MAIFIEAIEYSTARFTENNKYMTHWCKFCCTRDYRMLCNTVKKITMRDAGAKHKGDGKFRQSHRLSSLIYVDAGFFRRIYVDDGFFRLIYVDDGIFRHNCVVCSCVTLGFCNSVCGTFLKKGLKILPSFQKGYFVAILFPIF
jgi:hypothetical protein